MSVCGGGTGFVDMFLGISNTMIDIGGGFQTAAMNMGTLFPGLTTIGNQAVDLEALDAYLCSK